MTRRKQRACAAVSRAVLNSSGISRGVAPGLVHSAQGLQRPLGGDRARIPCTGQGINVPYGHYNFNAL